jgi:hypothetical protein
MWFTSFLKIWMMYTKVMTIELPEKLFQEILTHQINVN